MGLRLLRFRTGHFAVALILLYLLGAGSAPEASAQQRNTDLRRMALPGTDELQLIIELTEPAVFDRLRDSSGSRRADSGSGAARRRRMNFASAEARDHRRQIHRAKEPLKNRIAELPGVRIQGTTETLINTVIARVPAAQYATVSSLPGVRKVYFSRPKRMLLDRAAAIQNAADLWIAAGGRDNAGRGIKIGIIDSGIDINNPMFRGTGLSAPAGFPIADIPANLAYTNAKVIVARSYTHLLQQERSAADEIGHGTFVAAVAAGEKVDAPLASVSGMAPGAYLGNYKILGSAGSGWTTTAAELSAINDAVADGMDVINLSIGALDYLPPEENAEYAAIARAIASGVVVTVAAGNDGSMTHTITNPGAVPDAITVGSVTSSREFLAALRTADPGMGMIGYLPSEDGVQVTEDLSFTRLVDIASLDGDGLGCAPLPPGSLSGAFVLIQRGTCTFATKVGNSEAAGAAAVIIYNNIPVGLVGMIGLGSTSIPAVMISLSDGIELKEYINRDPASASAAIADSKSFQPVATTARVISGFSSVGPGTDFSIKPDLVAVGENIYSATIAHGGAGSLADATGFTVGQGTSFSAPMAAGAAAGLLQRFPSIAAREDRALAVKSLITSTADRNVTADGVSPANVLQSGSGVLNMSGALEARALVFPTSLNFGVHSYEDTLSLSAALIVENFSSTAEQFSFGVEPIVSGPAIAFSRTTTGTLSPGARVELTVTLQVDAPLSGGFQGFITIRSSSRPFVQRVPYWAGLYVHDPGRVLRVAQDDPASYPDLAEALRAARPGNVIEIRDSGRYPGGPNGLTVSTNGEGLPLHGLSLRAAAGAKPVVEAASLAKGISVVGLRDVLIQGLTIRGGYTGIDLYQPSPSVPLSVTIDQCTITEASGDDLATGVWIEGGGSIDITHSTISNSSGPGVIASASARGAQLSVIGSRFTGNLSDGADVFDTNVYISDSDFSGNSGAGLYLDGCTGTISGNNFSGNRNALFYGDGLQIAGGTLSVRNNTFENNDSMGIALTPGVESGPATRIVRNLLRGNAEYGLFSMGSRSVVADSNLIERNGGGIYLDGTGEALLLNDIVAWSGGLIGPGHGIEIAGGTKVGILNNTVFGNASAGVVQRSGTVSVKNSIVYGNRGGDLLGIAQSAVRFSRVSADPLLVAPDSGDFSPAPGSPVIDAGSNAVADLPFLDFNGKLRIAPAAGGRGTVDIGAIESNSSHPLIYPLTVNGWDESLDASVSTGIAFSNPSDVATDLEFAAYGHSGAMLPGQLNPASRPLGASAQLAIFDHQLFGFDSAAPSVGSVLGLSQSKPAGFYLFLDLGARLFSTGANAVADAERDLIFMKHKSNAEGKARYVVFNPGAMQSAFTAKLYREDGTGAGEAIAGTIQPKGSVILDFDSVQASSGYIRVESDQPLAGVELVSTGELQAALGAFSPDSQTRLFFPHYAVGGNYSTMIGIVNTGDSEAALTLNAYEGTGKLIGSIDLSLPARGQMLKTVTELFGVPSDGPLRAGYLVVQSSKPGIMGFTSFTYTDGDRKAEAMIPADATPSRRLLFSHIAQGVNAGNGLPYHTGIALLNPFGTAFDFTISVYDGSGALVAEDTQTIGARERISKILTHPVEGVGFFTRDLVLGNGHVEVASDYGLLGLQLFFTWDVSQLASVPAQVID